MFFGSQIAMKSVTAAEVAAMGAWRTLSVGDRVGALIFNDSEIREIPLTAAGKDDRGAGFTGRYTKWGSVEEAFKFWGERIKKFMDDARSVKVKY